MPRPDAISRHGNFKKLSVQAQSVACLLRNLLSRSHNQGKYTLQRTLYLGKPAHYSPPRNNFVKRRTTGKGNAINVLGRKYRMICRKPSALFNEFPFFDRFLLFFFFFFCRDACQTKCKKLEWGQKLLKLYFANIFCNIGISGEFWDSGESREFVGIVGKFR